MNKINEITVDHDEFMNEKLQDPEYQKVIRQMKQEMMRLRDETGDTDAGTVRMHEILRSQGLE